MRSLITGGAGFIGSHLAETLLARGDEVTVIDDFSTGNFENVKHLEGSKKFTLQVDSIMNQDLMAKLVSLSDRIFHLAAAVGVEYIINNPLDSLMTNIKGTEIVLDLANTQKRKVLIASTSESYGKGGDVPYKEDADRVLGPTQINRWSYACSKIVDEYMGLAYYQEKRLPVVIVRFFNVVGPRQSGQYGMVIPRFIRQALHNAPMTVYGDGKQTRSFAYVGDIVRGVIALMEKKEAEGEIVNLGSDEEVTILDLAKRIKKMTKSTSTIDLVPYEKAFASGFEDMMRRVPDISKAKRLIKYEPAETLDTILEKTIAHFQK